MFDTEVVKQKYTEGARIYDWTFPLWTLFGFHEGWGQKALRALNLRPGSTVLELGCGTGLNFPFLQEAVGPTGKIIGLDLTPAMLAEAQKKIERHGWHNVELIEADATRDELPQGVDGILAAGLLQVIPDHDTLIRKCAGALRSGGRLVVVDGTAVSGVLGFFLNPLLVRLSKSFGVSHESLRRKPWEVMRQYLTDVQVTRSRLFPYLASGTKVGD